MRKAFIHELRTDRRAAALDDHQIAPVTVLLLQAVRDHVELPLVQQGSQTVRCTPGDGRLRRAFGLGQFGCVDPDDADAAIA